MHPSKRTKTVEECDATVLILGGNWSYGLSSHSFFTRDENCWKMEWYCAETWEPLTGKKVGERRREYRHWKWEHEDV